MGYSDQKFYARRNVPALIAQVSGTATASATTNNAATTVALPQFQRKTKINNLEVVVKTAATASTSLSLSFLNGTVVFATIPTGTSTAGSVVQGTLTNTASTAVTTQTTTFSNGSTAVSTITTTTDYSVFASGVSPTVKIVGTATASGDSAGSHELYWEEQEQFS